MLSESEDNIPPLLSSLFCREGAEEHKIQKLREKFAQMSGASPGSGIQFMIGSAQSQESGGTPTTTDSQMLGGEFLYKLSLDEESNEITREDFYYDHVS